MLVFVIIFFLAFPETNNVWTISGRDVVNSWDLIFSRYYKSLVVPLKNGQIWWFMTQKMWPLKCLRFIALVWVSSRTGFSYKNARENPKTKMQLHFVPFKGTSNPSLFRKTGTWRLMDRYKIFIWLQAVSYIPTQYFLHYALSLILACRE